MYKRHRRLRENAAIRSLVRETILNPNDFILPIFVVEGENIKKEISGNSVNNISKWKPLNSFIRIYLINIKIIRGFLLLIF